MNRRFRGADGRAFAVLVVVVAFAAGVLMSTRLQGPATPNPTLTTARSAAPATTASPPVADVTTLDVHMSMAGFEPTALTVRANHIVRLELTSMDNPLHLDGGGWHEFAIDALGIDLKVGPEDTGTLAFSAPSEAGTYRVYCDTCCGGKENPTMLGTLTVSASHAAYRATGPSLSGERAITAAATGRRNVDVWTQA